MEENKKCCEKSECEKCNTCCPMSKCCMWQKCPMVKYLIWLIIIVIVFCLGAQYEKMKTPFRSHSCSGKMMYWDSEKFENKFDKDGGAQATDSVTVDTKLPAKQ